MKHTKYLRRTYKCDVRVTDDDVLDALDLVDSAGVVEQMEEYLAQDRAMKGPGGRRPWLDVRAMWVVLLLSTSRVKSLLKTEMTGFVLHGLTDAARERLGIVVDKKMYTHPNRAYDRLDRSMTRFLAALDPYPGPRRTKLLRETFEELQKQVDPERQAQMQRRLHDVCTNMLMSTYHRIPEKNLRHYKGDIAVDGTFVPLFGQKGDYKGSDYCPIEPQAGWHTRTKTNDPKAKVKTEKKAERVWGMEGTLARMVNRDPDSEPVVPQLIVGMALHKPSTDPGGHAITAIEHLPRHGVPTGRLVGDRAYGNSPKADVFQKRARALGYSLVFDMRRIYLGQTFEDPSGAIILEGNAYCASIKAYPTLVSASLDHKDEVIDDETYQARLKERARFLLRPLQRPQKDGSLRVSCPRHSGGVKTPSFEMPPEDEQAPMCSGEQLTATLKGESWQKHAMDSSIQYGTKQWDRAYSIPRQAIESANAGLKSEDGMSLEATGKRRTRGVAAATIFTALQITAWNLERLERWLEQDVQVDERGRTPVLHRVRRRRAHTYGPELTPGRRPVVQAA